MQEPSTKKTHWKTKIIPTPKGIDKGYYLEIASIVIVSHRNADGTNTQ
jgi:hypothetical protein